MSEPALSVALTTEAFRVILERFQAPLIRFVQQLTHSDEDAHDLVQDAFVDAWRATQRQTPPFVAGGDERAVRNWLFRAAYCNAISVLRHRGVITWESLAIYDAADDAAPAAPGCFEDQVIEGEALRAALAALESTDVACLRLSTIEGFSTAEIAQILDIAPAAARKRLSRAMHRLRAAYLAQEADARKRETV